MRKPNGYGSVTKLSGKRRKPYAIRVTDGWAEDGKQNKRYLAYFEKRLEAEAFLAKYNENPYAIHEKKTLYEVYELFYKSKDGKVDKDTTSGYEYGISKYEKYHDIPIAQITLPMLQEVMDGLSVQYASKRKIRSVIRLVFGYAMKVDLIEKDNSQYVEIGKKTSVNKKAVFTKEEIKLLWDTLGNNQDQEMILILLYTGLRPSEFLDLQTKNVFLDQDYMIGGGKTDAGTNRIIPIHPDIKPFIEKRYSKNNEYLINGKHGVMKYSNFRRERFDPIMIDLGMTHTPHECRHTFISQMDDIGVNKVALQRIVGHASKNVTDKVYTHKTIEMLIETMNQLNYL